MTDDRFGQMTRRRILSGVSITGLGLVGVVGTSPGAGATKDDPPEPYPKSGAESTDPTSPVYFTHIAEHESIQRRLGEYAKREEPNLLYTHAMEEWLKEHPDEETLDLLVTTMGRRNEIRSRGTYKRLLHGFVPKTGEINALERFGEITYVPEVAGTKVAVHDVPRGGLSELAALPFVVRVNVDLPITFESTTAQTNTSSNIQAYELLGSNYFDIDGAESNYTLGSDIQLGIIDNGYEGNGNSEYAHSWAEDLGIDYGLSKDFTSDDNPWYISAIGSHGDNVADSAAYILKEGDTYDDLFVILKAWSSEESASSNAEEAIDYALLHDIDILNMSFEVDYQSETCPSTLCQELYYFTDAGYLPFASTGNNEDSPNSDGVTFPGGEALTIGVGGIDDDNCTSGKDYRRWTKSMYGTVGYSDTDGEYGHCPWCETATNGPLFHPFVYGCADFETSVGSLEGTSMASPQAAATGIMLQSVSSPSYETAQSVYRSMSTHAICHDSEAQEGQLLDACDTVNCS